ncbi:MAG: hypothetical protein ACI3V0_11280 [Faecousia sp.]
MDQRAELKPGDRLFFPGMDCMIVRTIGCGSNAIVYEGEYQDATSRQRRHRVLIKELFPYDPGGHIWRDERGCICRDANGEEAWALHQRSFERGNSIHLKLLAQFPDQIGGNLNTYPLNQTLYTLLDYSGGRSLDKAIRSHTLQSLSVILQRMRKLLLALSVLHDQGFLHLDISPENVLLIGEGELERVLLIDYNSIHDRDELAGQNSIYFSAKEGFTAPEVRTGIVSAIGPCTDLFSVTCVFYAMLTGIPPTLVQLSRKTPPDALDSPLLRDAPATVKAQIAAILRRGLCVLPDRRYRSCAAMLRDLEELERRLAGVGVTHAALWEAGRRGVQRLIRQNPSLCYVEQESRLYPLRIQETGGASMSARAWIDAACSDSGASAFLVGDGGMGKSTALLRSALSGTSRYTSAKPAIIYLPLMGVKRGEPSFILDHILMELRFDARTQTMEDARHALIALLNPGPEHSSRPVQLLLLMDGLNEATGDTSALLTEICRLSSYSALRMVIATRTVPDGLTLNRAAMVPLDEQDILSALTAHGLLLPESADMRQLLQTPLMLSLYIQTAGNLGGQVQCQSRGALIDGYLNALCQKAAADRDCTVDYRMEAAVRLVLPAIAREIQRRGRPLNDQELYQTVRRCHRLLRGRVLLRAFPQWIGHSPEILGDAMQSAEAWYGEIVQHMLWQQMGLLVRGEDGCYHILHQIIQDHLIGLSKENERRIRSRKARAGLTACLTAVLMACAGLFIYNTWLKPRPYDERKSIAVMDAMATQYIRSGLQYEAMLDMLSGKMDPKDCAERIAQLGSVDTREAQMAFNSLLEEDADVIPWSGKPLEFESVAALLALPVERQAEYDRYIRAYQLALQGDTSTKKDEFDDALLFLLNADADVAWLLDQLAAVPHVEGMDKEQRLSYDTGLRSLPSGQKDRSVDTSRGVLQALEQAKRTRQKAKDGIDRLSVMSKIEEIEEYGERQL